MLAVYQQYQKNLELALLSSNGVAAVGDNGLASDVAGAVAGQKQQNLGDFFRLSDSADQRTFNLIPDVAIPSLANRRVDKTRRDGVDGDVRGELFSQSGGHRDNASLGDRIWHIAKT